MKKFIPVASPFINHLEAKAVYRTIKSGWISMGRKVEEFEDRVCKYVGCKYAIGMNNGTSTLDALLTAMNITEQDEIIVPSLTYIASANVVQYKKAKLVLCDIDPATFNTNVEYIKKKITKKTKLIIVTDMKGMPVDYDSFTKLSKMYRIPIIGDSAESFGALYKGKKVGSQFLAHSFSFFANKNITTGEGGMILTNNLSLYKKLKIIRNQGQQGRYNHVVLGNNYRMTDIQATIGIEQLKKLNKILKSKERVAKNYFKKFHKMEGVLLPFIPTYVSQHSWYNFAIKVNSKIRNKLVNYLKKKGIETRMSFPCIHTQAYYVKKFKYKKNDFPNSSKTFDQLIDLPIWAGLSLKNQSFIVSSIKKFFNKN